MSRNGSGTYNLPAGNPVVTGNTISSSWANTTLSDIASALTGSIAADGQTTPTANLVMGTYAHTGVGNATARTMYASAGQVQDSTLTYLTSVAGTNAITASAPIVMTAYATGQTFRFIAAGASTGAVTININSIGLKSVVRTDGSALVSGDIASGAAVQIMYDGTNFQLLSDANGKSETFTAITTGSLTDTGLTSGRVTYASTGGLLADSASLTYDGTTLTSTKFAGAFNGSLGATTPSTVVATTISGSGNLTLSATDGNILAGTSAGRAIWGNSNTTSYIVAYGATHATLANNILFANNANTMTFNASGNLGIGTTSPAVKLHAYSSGGEPARFESSLSYSLATVKSTSGSAFLGISGDGGLLGTLSATPLIFKPNDTERMRLDSSGNLGLGVTPSAWGSAFKAIDVGSGAFIGGNGSASNGTGLWYNSYFNGSNLIYKYNGFANYFEAGSAGFLWKTAPSGTAGNAITFTQAMTLDASGNLLVGVTSVPTAGQGGASISAVAAGGVIRVSATGTSTTGLVNFNNPNGNVGYIATTGVATAYVTTSDYRLKEDIAPMIGALATVQALKPVTYKWKADGSDGQGFIAHELAEVVPDCVSGEKDATKEEEYEISPAIPAVLDEEGNEVTLAVEAVMGTRTVPVYQGIDTSFLVATLTAAIQELSAKVTALEAQLGTTA